jgi:serine/threonine protein kinase
MSPEQADFQITDKRSDLFSVGVVLANLLLGRNMFKGATAEESRQRIMNQPIPDFRALDRALTTSSTTFCTTASRATRAPLRDRR